MKAARGGRGGGGRGGGGRRGGIGATGGGASSCLPTYLWVTIVGGKFLLS